MPLPTPQKTKIGNGFYQFSYGEQGWITVSRSRQGDWSFDARRHVEFETFGDRRLGVGKAERVAEGNDRKTMKEALADGAFYLLPRDEQESLRQAEREEIRRTTAEFSARLARNEQIIAEARAKGLIR